MAKNPFPKRKPPIIDSTAGAIQPGNLFDFVRAHANCDQGLILGGFVGENHMPLGALLVGAPVSRGTIAFDITEWRLHLNSGYGILLDNPGLFHEAAMNPGRETLEALRPCFASDDEAERRLDYFVSLYGDVAAARRLERHYAGLGGLQPAFTNALVEHAKHASNYGSAPPYHPGVGLKILIDAIRYEVVKANRHQKIVVAAAAWQQATQDKIVAEQKLGHTETYDVCAWDAIAAADNKVAAIKHDVSDIEERMSRDSEQDMEDDKKDEAAGFGVVEAVAEPSYLDWKDVPKLAMDALIFLEQLEDRQCPVDMLDPAVQAQVLAAAIEAGFKVPEPEPEAPLTYSKRQGRFLDAPMIVQDHLVLSKIVVTKTASANDNELLRAFAGMSGESLPLCLGFEEMPELRAQVVAEYPHAAQVVDLILADIVPGQPIRLRPTLLVGAPGSGKTSLLSMICELLYLPALVFPCGSVADSSFGGTSAQWASRRASIPLDAIRQRGCANPVVVLDEIEKTGQGSHNGSLVNALLPFLEEHSSKSFFEVGLEMPADLSRVNYLATANDLDAIPKPLKDRFRILRMPDPGPQHIGDLSRNIIRDVLKERSIDPLWSPPLAPDELDVIRKSWGGGSIRRLRRAVVATLDAREAVLLGSKM